MMSHTYAPLDVEKFRKLAELARRTTFFGERQGALAACTRIAASAGLNLEEAAKLAGVQLGKTIQEFKDALRAQETLREQDEARRKAEEEARRKEEDAARQKEEAARHEEQIARDKCDANIKTRELQSGYFSFDTFESIFIQACINLQQEKGQTPLDKKSRYGSIDGFDGAENTTLSQELRDTICLACPLPSRFAQAWDEWCYWNHLAEERRKTYPAYLHVTAVAARELLVVECLLTLPTNTLKEIVDWSVIAEKHSEIDRTSLLEEFRTRCLHFHTTSAPPPFSAKPATPYYRSRRDKQDEVRKALLARPHLSDRKIAAEIGVSPSTVGKIRKGL